VTYNVSGMTQRATAKALGISRTLEQWIERRALAKLALAWGEPPLPEPAWMTRNFPPRKKQNRCGSCGELGHNARGCTEAP
jgi:hypothetical protein